MRLYHLGCYTFRALLGHHTDGAVNMGQMELDACDNLCFVLHKCWAYDYNHNDSKCWIHTGNRSVVYKYSRVDHYMKVTIPCKGGSELLSK